MSRKERIKTYLTGVAIGVAVLILWTALKQGGQGRGTTPGGVASPSAESPEGEAHAPETRDDEASRRTP